MALDAHRKQCTSDALSETLTNGRVNKSRRVNGERDVNNGTAEKRGARARHKTTLNPSAVSERAISRDRRKVGEPNILPT
jgi:hypothetical protein